METKRCSKCGEEKPLSEFYTCKSYTKKGGRYFRSNCKLCENTINARYRELHKKKMNEYRRKWEQRNKDKVCAFRQLYRVSEKRKAVLRKEKDSVSYAKRCLIGQGFTDITPDLIELKRAELKLKRAIKEKTNGRG